MIEDPIVAEIHQIREEYARKFNYDLDAMFRDIQEKQSRSGRTYVSFPPKRPERRTAVLPAAPVQETASVGSEPSVRLVTDG
jgi:hypothetical protein